MMAKVTMWRRQCYDDSDDDDDGDDVGDANVDDDEAMTYIDSTSIVFPA